MYFVYCIYQTRYGTADTDHWYGEVSYPQHYRNPEYITSPPMQNLLGLRKTDCVWLVPGTLRPEQA